MTVSSSNDCSLNGESKTILHSLGFDNCNVDLVDTKVHVHEGFAQGIQEGLDLRLLGKQLLGSKSYMACSWGTKYMDKIIMQID